MNEMISERRIVVSNDMADFVTQLSSRAGNTGPPFETVADLLAFAAAYGAMRDEPTQVNDESKSPAPIRYEVFCNRNYDTLIDLLATYKTEDVDVLRDNVECLNQKLEIFEGYANTGLRILDEKLSRHANKLDAIELLLKEFMPQQEEEVAPDITSLA